MLLKRTGMGLLLRPPDDRKRDENGFAFNFQLPCKIVDSNLTHPAFLVLRVALRSSLHPHGVSVLHRTSSKMPRVQSVSTIQFCRKRSPLPAPALLFRPRRLRLPPSPQALPFVLPRQL